MELPVWSIMVVLLIRSAGTAFHSPAFSAATPMIVPKEELTKCAGYTQTMQAVSAIISPAAAAFLYAVWPLNAIILLDIVGAILACVTVAISSIPTPELCPETKRQQFLQDMKEGYVVLKQNRGLFALLWIGVIYMFFYMPISTLFPLICMSYFKGTPAHASAAEIAFAVGMLLGGVILSIWGGFKKRRYTIGLSVLLMGVSNMLSGLLPPDAFLGPCCVLYCYGNFRSILRCAKCDFSRNGKTRISGESFFSTDKRRFPRHAVWPCHFRASGGAAGS